MGICEAVRMNDLQVNMTKGIQEDERIRQAKEDLFHYAIDREEVKWLMEKLHGEAEVNRTAVEYELGVMKIVATGWAISAHLAGSPFKQQLLEGFWGMILEFSNGLSETATAVSGTPIDYFQVLKQRLDHYVASISNNPDAEAAKDPAVAIGPEFAAICGNRDDLFTRMTGTRMFITNISRVRAYLKGAGFI